MADYYRDVIRHLKDNGYEFKRQGRGDHEIWWHPKTGHRLTVDRKFEIEDHRQRDSEGRWATEGLLIGFGPDLAVFRPAVGLT